MKGYNGWKVSESDRARLKEAIPPKFERWVGHHVTDKYGVRDTDPLPAVPTNAFVVGVVEEPGVQALVIEIDGTTQRDDEYTFHLTWSLDLDKRSVEAKHATQYWPTAGVALVEPIEITLEPAFFRHGTRY